MTANLLRYGRTATCRMAFSCGGWVSVRAVVLVSLIVGVVPIGAGWAMHSHLHQPLVGLLLAPIVIGCIARGRTRLALISISLTVISHSASAIWLSATDPDRAGVILQGSEAYWEQTRHWIVTGTDPEYDWRRFIPAHLLLVALVIIGGYFTFSALPLMVGIRELDLMNFYVGRLIAEGNDPLAAVAWGWHPWSFIRGLSYSFLLVSATSRSLARITGRSEEHPRQTVILFR